MANMFIKPAVPGSLVRDPVSMLPLSDGGEWKPESPFWLRRLRDGDVVSIEPEKPVAAKSNSGGRSAGKQEAK